MSKHVFTAQRWVFLTCYEVQYNGLSLNNFQLVRRSNSSTLEHHCTIDAHTPRHTLHSGRFPSCQNTSVTDQSLQHHNRFSEVLLSWLVFSAPTFGCLNGKTVSVHSSKLLGHGFKSHLSLKRVSFDLITFRDQWHLQLIIYTCSLPFTCYLALLILQSWYSA